jgi:hypothetical protein
MASHSTISGVMEFLASYRKAFADYDTEAIVDHYTFPCPILSDSETMSLKLFEGPEQCKAGVDYVLSLHREIGVKSSKQLLLHITELSPRLAGMMMRSQLEDGEGKPLYEFQGFYSLARTDSRFKIAAISHNQIPRLLACAGRPSIPIS